MNLGENDILIYVLMIFTKFHEDRSKNVDFLLVAILWGCLVFYSPDFTLYLKALTKSVLYQNFLTEKKIIQNILKNTQIALFQEL